MLRGGFAREADPAPPSQCPEKAPESLPGIWSRASDFSSFSPGEGVSILKTHLAQKPSHQGVSGGPEHSAGVGGMGFGVPCQCRLSWPFSLRTHPHPIIDKTLAAALGFFPRIRIWISCLLAVDLENTLFPTLRPVGQHGSRAAVGSPTQFCNAGWRGWAGGCLGWVEYKRANMHQTTPLPAGWEDRVGAQAEGAH